jgi:hypothetical protein
MKMITTHHKLSNTELGIKERGKGKYPADYGLGDYYKYYLNNLSKDELPLGTDLKDLKYNVSFNKYRSVLMKIFRKARTKMILTNSEYQLPCKMGKIIIQKVRKKLKLDENGEVIKRIPIDYKATRQLWATDAEAKEKKLKVYQFNDHTNGYRLKIVWLKKNCNMNKKKYYKLTAVREFKRQLPELIKKHPELDFFVSPFSDY